MLARVRKYTENFKGKKAALVGVATGRAGNLERTRSYGRHTQSFRYSCASQISNQFLRLVGLTLIDDKGVVDETTINLLRTHAKSFIDF